MVFIYLFPASLLFLTTELEGMLACSTLGGNCHHRFACCGSGTKSYIRQKMRIVWDEPKRKTNLERHGLDLAQAKLLDWDSAIVVPGHAGKDGRLRSRAIGWLGHDLVALVFSPLGTEALSVVSLRRASRAERRMYEKATT